ncbi:MAG: hypothetical protein RI947_84 [Candidatus Parcubacteria bacterium]|jgi:Zn finger protein HypA/HybF involved in hydrogenase expression
MEGGVQKSMVTMYCVKCRAKRELEDGKVTEVTMKNGKTALKGNCPVCGTGTFKIGSKK